MKKILDTIHHFFVPRRSNSFRAKLLHHDFMTIYLIFAITLSLGIGHIQKTSGNVLGFATDITVNKLFELSNEERAKLQLEPLKYNKKLSEAAEKKADDMFKKDYWSHYGPSGETPWDFILGAGYQYEFAGENLAKNFLFSDGVVNAWMASPTHKENILRPDYTDVGYAIKNGVLNGEETTLVVQMFGKPLYLENVTTEEALPPQNQPIPVDIKENKPVVLAQQSKKPEFITLYFNMNIAFYTVLILALLMDLYFAVKLNIITIKGKNIIHSLFIAFITIGAYIIAKGSII
nr:CAP domain-containing protein [uncultured Flavobacterium sp.]